MGDFKAQLESDMSVFFNPGEFAQVTHIWYLEKLYTVPLIIERSSGKEREKFETDHAEGIYLDECRVYIALRDLGFVPKKDRTIEIEEGGAVRTYRIAKADCEDGEITLKLELMDE